MRKELREVFYDSAGRVLREIAQCGRLDWEMASNMMFLAADQFAKVENHEEAIQTFKEWYICMGARTVKGEAQRFRENMQRLGCDPNIASELEIYWRREDLNPSAPYHGLRP